MQHQEINLKSIMLKERGRPQNAAYCYSGKENKDLSQNSSAQIWVLGKGLTTKRYKGTFWGDGSALNVDCDGDYMCMSVCIWIIDIHTSARLVLLYVNYTPTNLTEKEKKRSFWEDLPFGTGHGWGLVRKAEAEGETPYWRNEQRWLGRAKTLATVARKLLKATLQHYS